MPSNYLFRVGGALRQGIRKSISGQERGLQLVEIFSEERLLFGKAFCSVSSARLSDLHVFVRPGAFAVTQTNLNIVNQRKNISVISAIPHAFGFKGFHSSSAACISAGAAPDVSFDNSLNEVQRSSSANSSEQKIHIDRSLKLNSGSSYLPHPDKEEKGGEDAHFICIDEQVIGIADGVGGWADVGVDAGEYSRELMANAVMAIREEPKGSVDPARVLEKAYTLTRAKGSSTACIIALTDQGLHAINLGDSGFMVIRDGCTVLKSPVQQHDFNFTYQLESGGTGGDSPTSGEVFKIPVAPGDVIIAGSDGLFDNLYTSDITAVVVHARRAHLPPQVVAQKIAALARERALDKNRQSPFSTAAQDAGIRFYGGKLDDVTVVVSYITSDKNVRGDYTLTCQTHYVHYLLALFFLPETRVSQSNLFTIASGVQSWEEFVDLKRRWLFNSAYCIVSVQKNENSSLSSLFVKLCAEYCFQPVDGIGSSPLCTYFNFSMTGETHFLITL